MPDTGLVHIIDDDAAIRNGLDSLLRSVGWNTRLYPTTSAFLDARREEGPACLILDIRLPGMSGLDFQTHLAASGIHLPVILITGHGDIPMTVRGMKAGAVDFLTKPFRDQDMLDAVQAAIARNRDARKKDEEADSVAKRFATLSPREQQVMMLVTAGKMNKQVAAELGLSETTVKIHRGSVMRKMDVRALADLVRMGELLQLRQ